MTIIELIIRIILSLNTNSLLYNNTLFESRMVLIAEKSDT
jgi:hypothetical protein